MSEETVTVSKEYLDELKWNLDKEQRVNAGLLKELHETEQTLGKVLGYPYYKDYPEAFPSAIEEDGVCVGDHTAGTIAIEATAKIADLEEEKEAYLEMLDNNGIG